MATSLEIRDTLVDALRLDLIGPSPGHALEAEVLEQHPSRWYLTGFLVPTGASLAHALEAGRIALPPLPSVLERYVGRDLADAAASELAAPLGRRSPQRKWPACCAP
jgi:hypothetical protein